MAPEEQVELGQPHQGAAPTCDSPVPQRAVRPAQRAAGSLQGMSPAPRLLFTH